MTTYPLSEQATIYAGEAKDDATSTVIGRGTLADCADIVAGLDAPTQQSLSIRMDELDLKFGPQEIGNLLQFLREEGSGLSNNEVAEIKDAGS